MALPPGFRLGPYEILAALGAGGMGEVYRARDTRLGRTVAIKVLPEHLVEDSDALARFERETKAVAALSHPNILALHDIGREGIVAYAVMELLEGETLRETLAGGVLSLRRATDYGLQMALGLAAAHEKGIVHRDLKPDNVFVTRDERVKILDFGLAKAGAATAAALSETQSPTVSGYTEPGKVMGTVGYMSPEQVRGLAVDHRSDIFSFGSVFFEMVTGAPAVRAPDGGRDYDSDPQGRSARAHRVGPRPASVPRTGDPPSPPGELTRDPAYSEEYPVWSPDGREVLFSRWPARDPARTLTLWIMNSDGTNPRRVTESSGPSPSRQACS